MTRILTLCVLALLTLTTLSGCDKSTTYNYYGSYDNDSGDSGSDDSDDSSDDSGSSSSGSSSGTSVSGELTVAEAQALDYGVEVCVCAYIVASCKTAMKYADFEKPFVGSTAIILSDSPVDLSAGTPDYSDSGLMPVELNTHIRPDLNLVDNPDLWNKKVKIYGKTEKYLSRHGLKEVYGYTVVTE